MADLTQRQKYDLKRQLEELQECKGKHTELISLYVPPTKQISDVTAYLRNELSQSQNIKSKTTKKNVLSAIESIMNRLKHYKTPPENGVVFFVGHKSIGSDQTSMVAHVVEPSKPINIFLYRCDSEFFIEPLLELLKEQDIYGLFLIDRRECTIGMLRGSRVELIQYMTSQVPGKHGRGGQSQRRFERLTELAAHEWFVKCGEKASDIFKEEKQLKGILVGGSGPTKQYFVEENYLHYEVQDKIIDVFDTGYTDEFGLRELVENASGALGSLRITQEKKIMKRFLREITKAEKSLAVYGESHVRKALSLAAVDTLLLAEDVRRYRLVLTCPHCKLQMEKTVETIDEECFEPPVCSSCGTQSAMQVSKKIDIIDELSDIAESTGATVQLISQGSEEGDSLYKAFGGVAGILRYPIDI